MNENVVFEHKHKLDKLKKKSTVITDWCIDAFCNIVRIIIDISVIVNSVTCKSLIWTFLLNNPNYMQPSIFVKK